MGEGDQPSAVETEMSLYSTIDRKLNADSWFRGLSHEAQLLWFRILTGPHVTPVAGLWAANEAGMAREFRFGLDEFRKTFDELGREPGRNGFARVISDWDAGVIWVPNAVEIPSNQPANLNVLISWGTHVELVPECTLKTQALQYLRTWVKQHANRYKQVPGWLEAGLGQVSPQDQDQDQEQDGGRAHAGAREESTPPAQLQHIRRFERSFQTTVESWTGWTVNQADRLRSSNKDPVILAGKFVAHHKSRGTRSSDWEAESEKWVLGDEERSRPTAKCPSPEDQLGGRTFT